MKYSLNTVICDLCGNPSCIAICEDTHPYGYITFQLVSGEFIEIGRENLKGDIKDLVKDLVKNYLMHNGKVSIQTACDCIEDEVSVSLNGIDDFDIILKKIIGLLKD